MGLIKCVSPVTNELVDLLDGRPSSAGTSTSSTSSWHTSSHTSHVRHSTWHTTWHSSCILVQLRDDGVADTLNLFLLVLEFINLGKLVGIEPLDGFVTLVGDGLHVILGYLVLDLLIIESSLHVEAVAFKLVLSRDPVLLLVILSLELLGIIHHPLNLFFGQTTLVIGDGDLVLLACALISSRHVQDTIGIDVKGNLNLRNSSGGWWNTSEIKLAKVMIILGHGSLTLVHLNGNSRLVVRVGGEGLGLLGGDGGVPLDQAGHHTSSSLNTKRERGDIKKKEIRDGLAGVTSQDGSLNSCTIGNSLIRVDGTIEFLSIKEILEEFLDLWDSGRSSNKDNVIDGALVHLSIPHGLLNRLQSSLEQVRAELLKPGPGNGSVEVDTLKQGINLNVSLSRGRESPLGTLTSSSQPSQSSLVPLDILLVFTLELIDKVIDHPVVEIFPSQVSVSSSGLDLKDALLNGQDGNVKSSATKVKDENIAFI